jgi:hypothetical protein
MRCEAVHRNILRPKTPPSPAISVTIPAFRTRIIAVASSWCMILICRGPGKLSIDHLLWRRFRHRLGAEGQSA